VIGIAGGKAKCDWVQSLGADVCLDYHSPDFEAELAKATEGGVDVYWDKSVSLLPEAAPYVSLPDR
jgi:NADPH-dependent curcumin reductase CurA